MSQKSIKVFIYKHKNWQGSPKTYEIAILYQSIRYKVAIFIKNNPKTYSFEEVKKVRFIIKMLTKQKFDI